MFVYVCMCGLIHIYICITSNAYIRRCPGPSIYMRETVDEHMYECIRKAFMAGRFTCVRFCSESLLARERQAFLAPSCPSSVVPRRLGKEP